MNQVHTKQKIKENQSKIEKEDKTRQLKKIITKKAKKLKYIQIKIILFRLISIEWCIPW